MVIALITDFGTRDHFVAAMKGAILSIDPSASIVDITHHIDPQNVKEAAFTLTACYRDFPAATVFVAVVDPGVGSDRRGIAAASEGYYFVGPDNGVLSPGLKHESKVVELNRPDYFSERVSNTFHGRDIFAPVAAYISKGVWLEEFGPPAYDPVVLQHPKPVQRGDGITGEIIHIDHFGNLITNLMKNDLPEEFAIHLGSQVIGKLCTSYSEADRGEIVTIMGSSEYLEIAANLASAEQLTNAKVGQPVRLTPKN